MKKKGDDVDFSRSKNFYIANLKKNKKKVTSMVKTRSGRRTRETSSPRHKECASKTNEFKNCPQSSGSCFAECYRHAAGWILPLLHHLPREITVSVNQVSETLQLPSLQGLNPYVIYDQGDNGPHVQIRFASSSDATEIEPNAFYYDLHVADSKKDAAEAASRFLQKADKGQETRLTIYFTAYGDLPFKPEFQRAYAGNGYRLTGVSFPGNDAWNRFRDFIKNGKLVLKLTRP